MILETFIIVFLYVGIGGIISAIIEYLYPNRFDGLEILMPLAWPFILASVFFIGVAYFANQMTKKILERIGRKE